jgi:hypothetical protein
MFTLYLKKSKNTETGNDYFKRLVVKAVDGGFMVKEEIDYGYGAGISETGVPSLNKVYKTAKGAENAIKKYKPQQYRMSLVEGLMQEGKI